MKDLNINMNLKVVEENTVLASRRMIQALQQSGADEDEALIR